MTQYHSGRRREWRLANRLKRDGYAVGRFTRSKGPLRTDLVAVKNGEVRFIQVKSGRQKEPCLSLEEFAGLKALAQMVENAKVTVEIWHVRTRWGRRQQPVAIPVPPWTTITVTGTETEGSCLDSGKVVSQKSVSQKSEYEYEHTENRIQVLQDSPGPEGDF